MGTAWAQQWRRTDRSFGELTDRLLDLQVLGDFRHALDIGCGAGELVVRLAASHPAAQVVGIDISTELIAVARERCAGLANAHVLEADATAWQAGPLKRPDLLISRHGVMFFANPAAAFAHLRAEAAPGAALRFSCFRSRADNGWVSALSSALPRPPDTPEPGAPGPFAFADPARVEAILTGAGWREVAFEAIDYPMIAGGGADAVDDALAYFQRIGPAARAIAELPEHERLPAIKRTRTVLARHFADGRVSLPAAAWIVTACAP